MRALLVGLAALTVSACAVNGQAEHDLMAVDGDKSCGITDRVVIAVKVEGEIPGVMAASAAPSQCPTLTGPGKLVCLVDGVCSVQIWQAAQE